MTLVIKVDCSFVYTVIAVVKLSLKDVVVPELSNEFSSIVKDIGAQTGHFVVHVGTPVDIAIRISNLDITEHLIVLPHTL